MDKKPLLHINNEGLYDTAFFDLIFSDSFPIVS